MECKHMFEKMPQTKSFDKKVFEFEALTCTKCGLFIWEDKKHQPELDSWLKENKIKIATSFRYQDPVKKMIQELADNYGVDDSKVIKALLSIYLKYAKDFKKYSELVKIYHKVDLKSPRIGELKIKTIRMTPSLFWGLRASAVHEGMEENISEFIRMALEVILSPLEYKQDFEGLQEDIESVLIAA